MSGNSKTTDFRLILLGLCFGTIPLGLCQADIVEWTTAEGGNGHFYGVVTAPPRISWFDARDQAIAAGGYLATITSAEENAFIWDRLSIGSTEAYWADQYDGPLFGGFRNDVNSPWQWANGEAWGYSNFNWGANPDFAVTQFIGHSPFWDDVGAYGGGAGGNVSYVVEYVPSPGSPVVFSLGTLFVVRRRRHGSRTRSCVPSAN